MISLGLKFFVLTGFTETLESVGFSNMRIFSHYFLTEFFQLHMTFSLFLGLLDSDGTNVRSFVFLTQFPDSAFSFLFFPNFLLTCLQFC